MNPKKVLNFSAFWDLAPPLLTFVFDVTGIDSVVGSWVLNLVAVRIVIRM